MEAICIKDIVVSDKKVFSDGEIYEFREVFVENKLVSYEIMSNFGIGVWDKKDPTLKKYFKREGDFGFRRMKNKLNKNKV